VEDYSGRLSDRCLGLSGFYTSRAHSSAPAYGVVAAMRFAAVLLQLALRHGPTAAGGVPIVAKCAGNYLRAGQRSLRSSPFWTVTRLGRALVRVLCFANSGVCPCAMRKKRTGTERDRFLSLPVKGIRVIVIKAKCYKINNCVACGRATAKRWDSMVRRGLEWRTSWNEGQSRPIGDPQRWLGKSNQTFRGVDCLPPQSFITDPGSTCC